MDNVLPLLFILLIAYFIFKMIRYGGFKGALFGGKITNFFGQVSSNTAAGVNHNIKVHKITKPGGNEIGLEITSKTFGSWQMTPVRISKHEARNLINLLEQAIKRS